jgi:hypothetical protein
MPAKKSTFKKTSQNNPTSKPMFNTEGKMSTFGGPDDHGMTPSEGLALLQPGDLNDPQYAYLFLPAPPPGTTGLGRRLNPEKYYLACRWDYQQTPQAFLRTHKALVQNPQNGRSAYAQPADWGPNVGTGRVADLSPGLAAALGLNTDDDVAVTISDTQPVLTLDATATAPVDGHGSSNPHPKPEIKEFVESPNHSSRNGARIEMVVLHCTEGSWASTKTEFLDAGGRQVSAHYVIDRNGDIYQMVRDSDRANHCRGANSNSIGIEHVGNDTQVIAPPQASQSAALIRWLLEQYDIPRSNIYGHDFAPGYDQSHGGTSCPDKLFGAAHAQQTIAEWVAANV